MGSKQRIIVHSKKVKFIRKICLKMHEGHKRGDLQFWPYQRERPSPHFGLIILGVIVINTPTLFATIPVEVE